MSVFAVNHAVAHLTPHPTALDVIAQTFGHTFVSARASTVCAIHAIESASSFDTPNFCIRVDESHVSDCTDSFKNFFASVGARTSYAALYKSGIPVAVIADNPAFNHHDSLSNLVLLASVACFTQADTQYGEDIATPSVSSTRLLGTAQDRTSAWCFCVTHNTFSPHEKRSTAADHTFCTKFWFVQYAFAVSLNHSFTFPVKVQRAISDAIVFPVSNVFFHTPHTSSAIFAHTDQRFCTKFCFVQYHDAVSLNAHFTFSVNVPRLISLPTATALSMVVLSQDCILLETGATTVLTFSVAHLTPALKFLSIDDSDIMCVG